MKPHQHLLHRVRCWRDERGNAVMVFALAVPLLVSGAGFAVETSFDYVTQSRLQGAADASAYAAAIEQMGGANFATIQSTASAQATSNGWTSGTGSITVNNPPTTGAYAGLSNAVEVQLTRNIPRFFTAYFSPNPVVAHARSVALTQTAANACILALNPTASAAVQVQGNTTVTLTACDVMSDSVASNAINVWGSSQLSADCAVSVGGVTTNGGMSLTGCPAAITQAPRAGDPLAGLAAPTAGQHQSVPGGGPNGTITLQPGSYTNGMNLQGNVVLQPGTYYVSGGDFKINANAVVSGSGVTIYMASGSQVSMNGNANVVMSAPTSGTYSGVLFFGDRSGAGGNTFNGDANSHLTGDLYFPTQQVSYQGNFSGINGCTHVIADTVVWTGSSTIGVNCSAQGMTPIPARQAVKLVE